MSIRIITLLLTLLPLFYFQSRPYSVTGINLTDDDSRLEVSLTSDTNDTKRITLPCDVLRDRKKALCGIVEIYSTVNFLIAYLRQCLSVVTEHHNAIIRLAKRFDEDAVDHLKEQQGALRRVRDTYLHMHWHTLFTLQQRKLITNFTPNCLAFWRREIRPLQLRIFWRKS